MPFLLSHGHIDHSGALPVLAKHRFSGRVHLTNATGDLTQILLQDSARIQEQDCRYVNKKERRRGKKCRLPFYVSNDAKGDHRTFSQFALRRKIFCGSEDSGIIS